MTRKRTLSRRDYALMAVRAAVQAGVLVKPEYCEECGEVGPVEATHPHGWQTPTTLLAVRWLCRTCRREAQTKGAQ